MRQICCQFFVIFVMLSASVELKAQSKSDFTRGEKIIFYDSLDRETIGEFPSKWDLLAGNVEVYDFQGQKVIGFMGKAGIEPYIKQDNYLPETFTLEFDAYFHHKGNEAYTIDFGKPGAITIRSYFAIFKEFKGETKVIKDPTWIHVAVSFNKRALKVYMNDERVLNVPNVEDKPLNVSFSILNFTHTSGFPGMMDNILLAEGGIKLYDRLITDGKIVTNDIHFESGKAVLKPESMVIIDQITNLLKEHPELRFRIEGHTDSDGNEQDNHLLSEKRALAVKEALVEKGIDESRLTTGGFGESRPVAENTTEDGKTKNRRVEFIRVD